MKKIILCLFVSSLFFSFQTVNEVKVIEVYKNVIDKHFENNNLEVKSINEKASVCGVIKGYYLHAKLVFIKTCNTSEFGFHALNFYIKNDSLVLVTEQKKETDVPKDKTAFDDYINKHTDKRGNTDLSKLPLAANDDYLFYMTNQRIIDSKLKKFNKTVTFTENEILEKNKVIETFYQSAKSELSR